MRIPMMAGRLFARRFGDLTGPNSPYRIERIAYWTWQTLLHPKRVGWDQLRYAQIELSADAYIDPLPVYGNLRTGAYSGVQFWGAHIHGGADVLRRLASVLNARADHVERLQEIFDAGELPSAQERLAEHEELARGAEIDAAVESTGHLPGHYDTESEVS